MNVSFIQSVCVRHDAISASIRNQMRWLTEAHHEVRLFAYEAQDPGVPFHLVHSLPEVFRHPFFQQSDCVVYHFGICYPLFDLVFLCPPDTRQLAVFHNITPREFFAADQQELHRLSCSQLANLQHVDFVMCDSEENLRVLRDKGVRSPAGVYPLCIDLQHSPPGNKPSMKDELIRLAFVGRFVRSKGIADLVVLVEALLRDLPDRRFSIDLIGNRNFSDPELLENLETSLAALIRKHPQQFSFQLRTNAPDEVKFQVLREADLFVLPSYHEGFCVPVLEALSTGCRVLTYDNSNLPDICGRCAVLVPTGDREALIRAGVQELNLLSSAEWREGSPSGYERHLQQSLSHVEKFSPAKCRERFLKCFENLFR